MKTNRGHGSPAYGFPIIFTSRHASAPIRSMDQDGTQWTAPLAQDINSPASSPDTSLPHLARSFLLGGAGPPPRRWCGSPPAKTFPRVRRRSDEICRGSREFFPILSQQFHSASLPPFPLPAHQLHPDSFLNPPSPD